MGQIVLSFVANREFMGSALVARGPEVLCSKGFGSPNLGWDIPNAPNTKFAVNLELSAA